MKPTQVAPAASSRTGDLVALLEREVRAQARLAPAIARETGLEVYAPFKRGWKSYRAFLEAYGPREGCLLLVALNPGPYGALQTGIPFTDVRTARTRLEAVAFDKDIPGYAPPELRDLLKLTYERSSLCVYKFFDEGWGSSDAAFADLCVTPFSQLLFVDRAKIPWNITPEEARLRRRADLEEAFARLMRNLLKTLRPRGAILVGRLAEGRAAPYLPVGMPRVIARHPAREPPARWGRDLAQALRDAGLL